LSRTPHVKTPLIPPPSRMSELLSFRLYVFSTIPFSFLPFSFTILHSLILRLFNFSVLQLSTSSILQLSNSSTLQLFNFHFSNSLIIQDHSIIQFSTTQSHYSQFFNSLYSRHSSRSKVPRQPLSYSISTISSQLFHMKNG